MRKQTKTHSHIHRLYVLHPLTLTIYRKIIISFVTNKIVFEFITFVCLVAAIWIFPFHSLCPLFVRSLSYLRCHYDRYAILSLVVVSWIDDIVSDLLAIKKNFGSCFLLFCYSIKYCLFVGSIWNLLWSSEIFVFFFIQIPCFRKWSMLKDMQSHFCCCLPNARILWTREKSQFVGRIYSYWCDSVRLCRFCHCCLYPQVESAVKCMHDLCWCTDKLLRWSKLYFINIGNYIEQSTCCHNVIFYDCFILRKEKKRCLWIVLMPKRGKNYLLFPHYSDDTVICWLLFLLLLQRYRCQTTRFYFHRLIETALSKPFDIWKMQSIWVSLEESKHEMRRMRSLFIF